MAGSTNEQKLEPLVNAVVNCQKGIDTEENFAILYNSTYRFVVGRLRNNELYEHEQADLEDYVQNIYIYVYKHLVDLKDPRAILAWLKIIVRGTVSDSRKTARYKMKMQETAMVTRTTEDKDAEEVDPEDDDIKKNPEAMYFSNSDRDAIREVIAGLPEAQRQAIIAYFFYGKKEKEIAEELGLNLNTVKSRLKSGRDSIYKRKADLKKRGVEIAIIPLVLLLHVAYDADPALAASLMSGAAIGGASAAASAKASAETAASAPKAAIGTGEATKTASAAAGGAKTAGAAGMSKAAAVGGAGVAKAVGTGIAVKAVAAVAAVAVAAGGATVVYKHINTPTASAAASIETTMAASLPTEAETSAAAEESSTVNRYADIYGDVLQEFASEHHFSLEELNIGLIDFDQDGELELAVSAGNQRSLGSERSYFEAVYKASDAAPALIIESDGDIEYSQTEAGTYFCTDAVIGSDRFEDSLSDEALWLLHDGICDRIAVCRRDTINDDGNDDGNEVLGEKTDPVTAYDYINEKMYYGKSFSCIEGLTYEDISGLSDEALRDWINGTSDVLSGTWRGYDDYSRLTTSYTINGSNTIEYTIESPDGLFDPIHGSTTFTRTGNILRLEDSNDIWVPYLKYKNENLVAEYYYDGGCDTYEVIYTRQ